MRRYLATLPVALLAAAVGVAQSPSPERALLQQYCAGCHNEKTKSGGLVLDKLDVDHPGQNPETWEKVIRKLQAGMMPPVGASRPERTKLEAFTTKLATAIDQAAAAHPNPGATALHRLNRAEYANAVRDLLGLEVDATTLLPPDDSSEGFDNIADVLGVSPALLERYVSAASKISRVAVGDSSISPVTATYRLAGNFSQTQHIEGLPLGTRGGTLIKHTFPLDGEYVLKIKGTGGIPYDRRDEVVEVTVNGARAGTAKTGYYVTGELRLKMKAGPQTIGVAFPEQDFTGAEALWQNLPKPVGVQYVAITGPLNATGPGDTPSRRRIFVCHPASSSEETPCAKKILTTLATRAYRRPATDADLETLLSFYQSGRNERDFESGVERALERVLVDARFIFRFEQEPPNVAPGAAYRISDLELASRLSFFLWSSIPDDELLNLAVAGKLHAPAVLEQQARRMLADTRAQSLVTNFAGQWLALREIKNSRPESKDFDDNLRQSFRQETELFFGSIIREDRSILNLLNADYTFVDERLARHYGIPNVYGSQFRRVVLKDDARRGLLGQGSLLLVTSVADRTSPVARGKWILENILGVPVPLPPPNVPPLKENQAGAQPTSVRARMEEHRSNPTCAACHKIMDPIGFSLENFDLVGKWRATDGGTPVDASGQLVDGTKLDGPASLREALLTRSDAFISTVTEKLLTYGVGRGVRYYDMPAVRSIIRDAARDNYRFSSLVAGIVKSAPFQMRVKSNQSAVNVAVNRGGKP